MTSEARNGDNPHCLVGRCKDCAHRSDGECYKIRSAVSVHCDCEGPYDGYEVDDDFGCVLFTPNIPISVNPHIGIHTPADGRAAGVMAQVRAAMDVLEHATCGAIGADGASMDDLMAAWVDGDAYGRDAYYDTCQHAWLLLAAAVGMDGHTPADGRAEAAREEGQK
jgi:hypothetical protein